MLERLSGCVPSAVRGPGSARLPQAPRVREGICQAATGGTPRGRRRNATARNHATISRGAERGDGLGPPLQLPLLADTRGVSSLDKPPPSPVRALSSELISHGKLLGGFVGFLWVVELVNAFVFGGALSNLGIHPRSVFGLFGILLAPLLHGSIAHLVGNTLPLLVLGWFVMLRRKRDFLYVSLLSTLVGGLGTWLIAPGNTVHVGASILIFGYLGHLLSRGIFERRFWPIVGSVIVFFLYGGALFGVLPGQEGISWQGHLFGFLGGVLAARMLGGARPETAAKQPAAPKRFAPAPAIPAPRAAAPASDEDIEEELARLRSKL